MNLNKCSHAGPKDGNWYDYFVKHGVIWNRRNKKGQNSTQTGGKKSHDIKPHVRLSGGMHADMYMNPDMVSDSDVIRRITSELICNSSNVNASMIYEINRVVAPQKGGAILAYEFARTLSDLHGPCGVPCKYTLLQKDGRNRHGPVFRQVGDPIESGDTVLICDDVLTTSRTVVAIDKLVRKSGAKTVFVAVLAIDSSFIAMPGLPVNTLCIKRTKLYDPDNCPLCRKGSRLITSPKEHWRDLVKV